MVRNLSETDQFARMILATVCLIVAVIATGPWLWLLVPSALLYITASLLYCPAYPVLGRLLHRSR